MLLVFAQAVTETTDIKPILDMHCVPCPHTIFNLSAFPISGSLIDRMRRTDWKRMPPERVSPRPLPEDMISA